MPRITAIAAAALLSAAPLATSAEPLSAEPLSPAALGGAPGWLAAVYEERGYEPVWSDGDRPNQAFADLLSLIEDAEARGLDPAAYSLRDVERLRREDPAAREVGAALAFARLAVDLIKGRTDPQIDYQPDFAPRREREKGELLRAAYARPDPAGMLAEPDNVLVERLTEALARYRRLAGEGGWGVLPDTDGDLLIRPSDTHALVPAIRRRLVAEGYDAGPAGPDPREADEGFVAALERFQASRSAAVDGVVGPATLAALNETPADLARRLEVNIERARWLPSRLGERAALVNAADYTLRLYEDDRQVDRMAVIVGEEETQTPIFADTMETVVVNPYWNVPSSILIGEIAPQQVADPTYVGRKGFEVLRGGEVVSPFSVDWDAAAAGDPSFRVRQTAGDHNALGRIKFLFPNPYAVYLHDTPADALFERDVRTFSHGCIRVEDPVRFGAWLLDRTEGELASLIEGGDRVRIGTPPLPVYITYLTAWAEPDGEVRFARDVYERDDAVAGALGLVGG